MGDQLNLLGTVDDPVDLELGLTQRAVIRELRTRGWLERGDAGAIAHHAREQHGLEERCPFCAGDGAAVLDSLVRRGLAEYRAGAYHLPAAPPAPSQGAAFGVFPEGF